MKNILHYQYSGRVFSLFYVVVQSGISFLLMKVASDFIKEDKLNMAIIFALLSLVIGILTLIKDHISTYGDLHSPYNKERLAHDETRGELQAKKDELEEKKDTLHDLLSSLNNTYISQKTDHEKLSISITLITALNKDKRISNCGNSKISMTENYQAVISSLGLYGQG